MKHHLYGTRLYINLRQLEKNIQFIRQTIKHQKIIAMVKANAYGHGDISISLKLEELGITYFGVADFEEGVRLREAGLKGSIMVMNPGVPNMSKILDSNLEPVIYNNTILSELIHVLQNTTHIKNSTQEIRIHLKLNTGMNRWGFNPSEIPKLITDLNKIKKIKIQSIYSHLASSKNAKDDTFTKKQVQILHDQKLNFINAFNYEIPFHICNSFGIVRLLKTDSFFNYSRIGLALYGGIENLNLNPVAELKCPVYQIRFIQPGDSIGYNRAHIAKHKMRIGIVPFGYADGLQRHWGHGVLKFFYKKQLIPTIGEISMDSCIVDLSEIKNISELDEVCYFGLERPIWELAKELNTIPYEIMATLSRRIKRIYYQ
tara:strand:- start:1393 stop:2511 length:1119 start_codon:yes stop_codon:yes gene_type:complete